jgi:hypothetical protein
MSANGYDVIEVDGGETFDIHDDFGGTLENTLFDQTGGGYARLDCTGGDSFTVRNVGWLGTADEIGDSNLIKVMCDDGEQGLFENVYVGDGIDEDSESDNGCLFQEEHEGDITFRYVNVQHFTDNAIYAANGTDGNCYIEHSYCANNNISQFRIENDSWVRDSVAVAYEGEIRDGSDEIGIRGARFENTGGLLMERVHIDTPDGRCIDTKDGGSGTVRDSELVGDIDEEEGDVELVNTNHPGSPQTSPPDGVPTSAEMAASGQSGNGGGTPGGGENNNTLRIVADQSNPNTNFNVSFDVSGSVGYGAEAEPDTDNIIDHGDGTQTASSVAMNPGAVDTWQVSGEVLSITESPSDADYGATYYWNGTQMSRDEVIVASGGTVPDDGGNGGNGGGGQPDQPQEAGGAGTVILAAGLVGAWLKRRRDRGN